jgi:hypothetical protein
VGHGSVDEVVARLEAIEDELRGRYSPRTPDLAPADGVACFNGLYLQVTRAVRDRLQEDGFFRRPAFIARLDVVFADFYFDAFDTAASACRTRGGRCSRAGRSWGRSIRSSSRWPG